MIKVIYLMILIFFYSCDFSSSSYKDDELFQVFVNKINAIEEQLTLLNNSISVTDSVLKNDISGIKDSLFNITNLLFLTLDNDFTDFENALDDENKGIDAENIFNETFVIDNIFTTSFTATDKKSSRNKRYFKFDTIIINDQDLIYKYTINKISNFEKFIEIMNINNEKVFKIDLEKE